jgi:hypothetical protein
MIKEMIDLDINNYNLEDILKLFNIENINFNKNDLNNAKQITLKMHPDKSELSGEYFIFYSKAYKLLNNIWKFKNLEEKSKSSSNNIYDKDEYYDESENIISKKIEQLDKIKFNNWFNSEFEKNKQINGFEGGGYGDWLKNTYENDDNIQVQSLNDMNIEIINKKKQLQSVIIYKDIQDIESSKYGTHLSMDTPENYDSNIFSQLSFQDLQKAHTETVIPVTDDDYHKIPKFNNVNDALFYRKSEETTYNLNKNNDKLSLNEKREQEESSKRYYKLLKETEVAQENNKLFWAKLKQLKN